MQLDKAIQNMFKKPLFGQYYILNANAWQLMIINEVDGYLRSYCPIKHNVGTHDKESQLEGWWGLLMIDLLTKRWRADPVGVAPEETAAVASTGITHCNRTTGSNRGCWTLW